jgi:rubredoxin
MSRIGGMSQGTDKYWRSSVPWFQNEYPVPGDISLLRQLAIISLTEDVSLTAVKRYRCVICGYIYSPLRGEPHNGIPEGTEFDDLPDSYVCPLCGMQGKGRIGKGGFEEWVPTKYICSVCGYVYDQKRGEPHRGIPAGTPFEEVPDDYTCPVCALDPKISKSYGKVFKQGFEPLHI